MGKRKSRFVAKAEAGKGWRIWDNLQKKWRRERYRNYPDHLLAELNGDKRPDRLTDLIKQAAQDRVR